jgi:predicted transcriptional regulator
MTQPAAAPATEAPRRGRPRPVLTIERDKAVASAMSADPAKEWTIAEMAAKLGWENKIVYACLNRLIWGGVAEKTGRTTYKATGGAYTSVYDPSKRGKRGT